MLLAVSAAEGRGSHVLLRRTTKRTRSMGILSMQLHRFFCRQAPGLPTSILHLIPRRAQIIRPVQDTVGLRCASACFSSSSHQLISQDAAEYLRWLLRRHPIADGGEETVHSDSLDTNVSRKRNGDRQADLTESPTRNHNDQLANGLWEPILWALREGDIQRVLKQLARIRDMEPSDLQIAVAELPRTTFTQIFRAVDPFRVDPLCDPASGYHVSAGMFKLLRMGSSFDDWGGRKIYTRLLRDLLLLKNALNASGQALSGEEYIYLMRCAGATSDLKAVRAIWVDLRSTLAGVWLNTEIYTEFIKARFLTEPLYTSFAKTSRMITPRHLHRSRLYISTRRAQRLDNLAYVTMSAHHHWGLNKNVDHVEPLIRQLRHNGPIIRLFSNVLSRGYQLDEEFLCSVMVAFGRSGSLQTVGTTILEKYFAITPPAFIPPEVEIGEGLYKLDEKDPPRLAPWVELETLDPLHVNIVLQHRPNKPIQPTVRLMRAIVETYGSNGEIALALELVEFLSARYEIPVPSDVWTDLLGWTHIMRTPPTSVAWKIAGLSSKIPHPRMIRMIWDKMTSPPHNQEPTFEHYNILIKHFVGKDPERIWNDTWAIIWYMKTATGMYWEQCRKYEDAALKYIQYKRDGAYTGHAASLFERERFKKERMWFSISQWCKTLIKKVDYGPRHPSSHVAHQLIRTFRPFLINPIRYRTPGGYVTLIDPANETFQSAKIGELRRTFHIRNREGWFKRQRQVQRKVVVMSRHSLAPFRPARMTSPINLIRPEPDSFEYGA
ncbi:mitochondrial ATPase expression-domain-containing protein [Poronia punctata]|nr:mitochondrial ATPase expression-domain-containing protein [Poronia punctata]